MENVLEQLQTLESAFGQSAGVMSRNEWTKLVGSGALVRVKVGRWRGHTSLGWDDLGLSMSDMANSPDKAPFRLGSKTIFEEQFLKDCNTIEVKARQAIEQRSFKTEFGHFVPASAYESLKVALDKLESRYGSMKAYLAENYDEMVRSTRARWEPWLQAAWEVYRSTGGAKDVETFVDDSWMRISQEIRSLDEMLEAMTFDVSLTFMPSLDASITDTAGLTEEALAMQRDVMRSMVESKQKKIDDFFSDVQTSIFEQVQKAVGNVSEAIAKKGKVTQKNAETLRLLIESVEELNFWDDQRVDAVIDSVKVLMENVDDTPVDDFSAVLNSISENAEMAVRQAQDLTFDFGHGESIDLTDSAGEFTLPESDDKLELPDTAGLPISF